jgi:hypothetical protein
MMAHSQADIELIKDIGAMYADPLAYVRYVFPWGEGHLQGEEGPDQWQEDVLAEIGRRVIAGQDTGDAIRMAISSGHGIGKTCLLSWIIKWFMATRDFPQVVVTANTQSQLSGKTWRELAKWNRLALDGHFFKHTATRFYHTSYPETWFANAVPWSEHNSEAFAGTHEKHVLVIYDEGASIPDLIWEVTEGAMTTQGAMWLVFGNPTRNTGRFRECFGRMRHRWFTRQIDSRTAKKANLQQIQQWIDDYGDDSDFVRVRVKGEFPRAGSSQFIGNDVVDNCRRYVAMGYESQPKILSVDVARFGDNQTVMGFRQGRKVYGVRKFRGLDTMQTAGHIADLINQHEPDTVVIDGAGIGGGVVDRMKQLGYANIIELNGGTRPNDPITYYNKRAECWGLMREALREGLELPDDRELFDDLIAVEYGFTSKQQIQLEKKEDMAKRGLASPDTADMLAMTFAVTPRYVAKRRDDEDLFVHSPLAWMA